MVDDGVDYDQLCQRILDGDSSLSEVVVVDGVDSKLVNALSKNSVVTLVSIENAVGLGDDIAAAVASMPSLTTIRLRNVGLTVAGAKKLASSLAWNNLRVLDLRDNPKLGPRGLQPLADKLSFVLKLEELNLSNCRMGHFGAKAIGSASLPPSLMVLDLSHNGIGNDGTWKLAPALKNLTNLESLVLSKNQIGDDGASEIGHQLPASLKTLIMRDNDIADVGAKVLADAVIHTQTGRLMLANNKIGSPGAVAISQIVAQSPTIHEIDLNGNEIGDDGASALAKSLVVQTSQEGGEPLEQKASALSILRLRDNNIGDAGAGAFVEYLDQNRNLVTLDLEGNDSISEARFHILDMILKHRSTPRRLSTGAGGVTTPPASPLRQEQSETTVLAQARKILNQSSGPVEVSPDYLELCSNHFDTNNILSYGAFGVLFRAEDAVSRYLIRRITIPHVEDNKDQRDGALHDMLALKHENILQIKAYSRGFGFDCFAYDFDGLILSLNDCICNSDKRRELTWRTRLQILCGVGHALDYLHNGGRRTRIHGDVKSSNIFIANDYTAKLIDCGVSQLVAADKGRFQTGDVVFGSRGYRCPRYERGSRKYSPESDVFSFGILMAEVCTGRLQNDTIDGQSQDFYYDYVVEKKRDLLQDCDASAGAFDERAIATVCKITLSCMGSEPTRRPGTSSIVRLLDSILKR